MVGVVIRQTQSQHGAQQGQPRRHNHTVDARPAARSLTSVAELLRKEPDWTVQLFLNQYPKEMPPPLCMTMRVGSGRQAKCRVSVVNSGALLGYTQE